MQNTRKYQPGARYVLAVAPTAPGEIAFCVATSTMDLVPGIPGPYRERNTRIVDLGLLPLSKIWGACGLWDVRGIVVANDAPAELIGELTARKIRTLRRQHLPTCPVLMPPEAETSIELRAVVSLATNEARIRPASIVTGTILPYEDGRMRYRPFVF